MELAENKAVAEYIKKFVLDPRFNDVRIAFLGNIAEGKTEDESKNFGKYLGTRFVFKTLEEIAKKPPTIEKPKKSSDPRQDPDLLEE